MSYKNDQERSLWIRAYLAKRSQANSGHIGACNCANELLSEIRKLDETMRNENSGDSYRDLNSNS